MQRLLFLVPETLPTFRVDVSALFGSYLPRLGVLSDIVSATTSSSAQEVAWGGGKPLLCQISGRPAGKYVRMFIHGCSSLLAMDRAQYQAIQVRDMPILAAIALIIARIRRLPFYYWMSYPIPEGQIALARERGLDAGLMKFLFPWLRGRVGKLLLYRFVLPKADHIFVQSEQMKQDVTGQGIDRNKMTPVPMGVDLEAAYSNDLPPIDDQQLKGREFLAYLGSLDRPRKIEILFDMLHLLAQHAPNISLLLIGDTEDDVHRAWLHRRADALGLKDNVIWTGWLPHQKAWRYVKAARVALSPIPRGVLLDCSSPTKLPEYLALGVPVVCNDNPDQASIIQQSGAGVCVPYTAEQFAAAVSDVLSWSEDRREKATRAGYEYVKKHREYGVLSERLAETYRTLVTKR